MESSLAENDGDPISPGRSPFTPFRVKSKFTWGMFTATDQLLWPYALFPSSFLVTCCLKNLPQRWKVSVFHSCSCVCLNRLQMFFFYFSFANFFLVSILVLHSKLFWAIIMIHCPSHITMFLKQVKQNSERIRKLRVQFFCEISLLSFYSKIINKKRAFSKKKKKTHKRLLLWGMMYETHK